MVKYIKFGKYNKNYIYVILTGIFMILANFLPSFLTDIFLHYELITQQVQEIAIHPFNINIFAFFGMLVISFILYKYEEKISENKLNGKTNLLSIIIIIIITTILESLTSIISVLMIFSFWMVILLIIPFTNAIIFKLKTYRHHKCSIFFCFAVLIIFQTTSFILLMQSENSNPLYKKYLWFLPIGTIIYLLYVFMCSWVYSKMKWFMNENWISLTKLFMIYSLAGFLINIIICIILTFIKCWGETKFYFCHIKDEKDNFYVENIILYFEKLSDIYEEKADLFFFIFITFLYTILISLYIYFFFSILKHLTPEHYYFSASLIDIFFRTIPLFQNKIFKGYYFAIKEEDYKLKLKTFLLNVIGDCISFVGFLIYLEIIELHFLGLNYNLRKTIIDRGTIDAIQEESAQYQNEQFIDKEQNKNRELSICSDIND